MSRRGGLITALSITGPLMGAPASQAAFPGKNGLIAYSQVKKGSEDIWVVGPKGGKGRDITRTRSFRETAPSFGPNGRMIAFSRTNRSGSKQGSNNGTHDLWIANAGGGGAHVFTHQPGFAKDPSWGPAPRK